MKAFTAADLSSTQWEAQVLMATVGLVEERDAQSARILCLGGLDIPRYTKDRLTQSIRAALGNPGFPITVECMSMMDFRSKFRGISVRSGWSDGKGKSKGYSGDAGKGHAGVDTAPNGYPDSSFSRDSAGKGKSKAGEGYIAWDMMSAQQSNGKQRYQSLQPTGANQRSSQSRRRGHSVRPAKRNQSVQPQRDEMLVVWVCGECCAYFDSYELLADHQQSEGHWNATLADCGRRFVSKEELSSLKVVGPAAACDAKKDSTPASCQIYSLGEDAASTDVVEATVDTSIVTTTNATNDVQSDMANGGTSLQQKANAPRRPSSKGSGKAADFKGRSARSPTAALERFKKEHPPPSSGAGKGDRPLNTPIPGATNRQMPIKAIHPSINMQSFQKGIGQPQVSAPDNSAMMASLAVNGGAQKGLPLAASRFGGMALTSKGAPHAFSTIPGQQEREREAPPAAVRAQQTFQQSPGGDAGKGQAWKRAMRSPTRASGKGNQPGQQAYQPSASGPKGSHAQRGSKDRWADYR